VILEASERLYFVIVMWPSYFVNIIFDYTNTTLITEMSTDTAIDIGSILMKE
jgi:hypothetical protein